MLHPSVHVLTNATAEWDPRRSKHSAFQSLKRLEWRHEDILFGREAVVDSARLPGIPQDPGQNDRPGIFRPRLFGTAWTRKYESTTQVADPAH
jgi:hypothetical protein